MTDQLIPGSAYFWSIMMRQIRANVLLEAAPPLPAQYKTWSECYDDQIRCQGATHKVLLESPYPPSPPGDDWDFYICWHSDIAVLINREWQRATSKPELI